MRITPSILRAWKACWSDERISQHFGAREYLTPREVSEDESITPLDRVWVLTHVLEAMSRCRATAEAEIDAAAAAADAAVHDAEDAANAAVAAAAADAGFALPDTAAYLAAYNRSMDASIADIMTRIEDLKTH